MSEKLILRLSSQPGKLLPWLVWSSDTQDVIASGELLGLAQLNEIVDYASGRKLEILVDASDVTILVHHLPNKPNRQILNAVPFMLEEELAEDIDKLHFTVAETGFDEELNQYWIKVVVIKKYLLTTWLEQFEQHGLSISKVIPESLCLAFDQRNDLSLLAMNDGWLVCNQKSISSFVDVAWLKTIISRLLLGQEQLKVYAASPIPEFFANEERIVVTEDYVNMPLLHLAKQASDLNLNLLHGEFQVKKAVNKNWAVWRPAMLLFGIIFIISLVESLLIGVEANRKVEELKQQLAEQYKTAFPSETPRLNIIRTQLRQKVARITGNAADTNTQFLTMMASLAPSLAANPSVELEAVRFEAKRSEIRLSAKASGFQAFEKFKNDLEQQGFDVTQGTLNNADGNVVGVLVIKGASQ